MSLAQQSQTWFPTHVQVTVLQAKALRSKGKTGTNDAYSIIQLGKEKYSTTVAEKSQAPVWKEEATFEVPLLHNDNQERCTVRVIVMHRALVGMDKFLGQVELNLWELHQSKNRKKTQWYPLKSKPGKKEKERGQIEIEIQFMRNNMTASMFDLSMKEKSRSPFGKLKDKLKGKRQDGLPDTASAIVPSMTQYSDDSDNDMPEVEKKKSKLKNLFSKPGAGLKKNSISQSMSVLPTFQPSSGQRTVLKPADFSSDFNPVSGSPVSERRFPHLPVIMTHKRTASADTKQLNQIANGNKKEGLSFFSGMRSKNDPITRSNLCINGNHVYMEENEPKGDSSKDNSLTNSPQVFRKSPLYASAENLSTKPPKDPNVFNPVSEKKLPNSASKDSLKSMTLPAFQSTKPEEPRPRSPPLSSDAPKEVKETKKQENKKSSLLSMMTGRKESPKPTEVEQFTDISLEESRTAGGSMKSEPTLDIHNKKPSLNPFDDAEEKKPEPLPSSERGAKTSAVKPRLDVSSEAETKAGLSSSSLSDSFLSSSLSSLQEDPFIASFKLEKEAQSQNTSTSDKNSKSLSSSQIILESEDKNEEPSESFTDYEKPSVPMFWRSGLSPNKPSEPKEVQVVAPFAEKNKPKKSTVKSLLDQLKGKPASPTLNDTVDEGLVKGIFPVLQETSPVYDEPESSPANKQESPIDRFVERQESMVFTPHLNKDEDQIDTDLSMKREEKPYVSISQDLKEPPKPTPRMQSVPKKDEPVAELKSTAPKPAPRSAAKINKNVYDSVSESSVSSKPAQVDDQSSSESDITSKTNVIMEQSSCVGASQVNNQVQFGLSMTNKKMATPLVEDLSYRLDELPVIPENPEGTSDDEQLETKTESHEISNNSPENKRSTPPLDTETSPYYTVQTNNLSTYEKNKVDFTVQKKDEKNIALESKITRRSSDEQSLDIKDSFKNTSSKIDVVESRERSSDSPKHLHEDTSSASGTLPSSPLPASSVSLSMDKSDTHSAKAPTTPDGSDKVENSGKKKLLRAWVSPSETHPIPTVQSGGTVSSRQRTHPVKPMNTSQNKSPSNFPVPIKIHENTLNNINTKKYDPSDPAAAYAQLTHDELIQLILKQKDSITRKENQVRELEEYIDNLLVRVMEETPNILRSATAFSKKAGKV
ncbi:rab11 family-interacting protein 1 [Discoglossus pictus]